MKTIIAAILALSASFSLAQQTAPVRATPLIAHAGERVSFVFTIDKDGGEVARQRYLEQTYALAQPLKLRALGQFSLKDKLYGAHEAERLAVFTLPSAKVSNTMRKSPEYAGLKELLPEGWVDMEVVDVDLKNDVRLTLFSDRYYTIAKVWVDDAEIHEAYVEQAGQARAELGIRILAAFTPDDYSSLDESRTAPYKLVLVEWPTDEVIQQYLQDPGL